MIKLMILITLRISRYRLIKNRIKMLNNKKVFLMNNRKYILKSKHNRKSNWKNTNKRSHNIDQENSLKRMAF